ncbi:hypothetical protein IAT38_007193 [Cryptococcus sp. DSM 104549]
MPAQPAATAQETQSFLADLGVQLVIPDAPSETDQSWLDMLGYIVKMVDEMDKTNEVLARFEAKRDQRFAIPLESWTEIQRLSLRELDEWIEFYEIEVTGRKGKERKGMLVLQFSGGELLARRQAGRGRR